MTNITKDFLQESEGRPRFVKAQTEKINERGASCSMRLNEREIIFITYSIETNWAAELPKSNWLCILVDNDRPRNYINEVISKIINNNVCYVCTVGQNCQLNHDLIDEEIAFREVDSDDHYLPTHNITTTWHTDFDEGMWFAIFTAQDEKSSIDKVLILDMTNGQERKRIEELLDNYKAQQKMRII